jgi:metal transporter CNNM
VALHILILNCRNDVAVLKAAGGRNAVLVERIEPLLEKPHWVLVTLLVVNSLCMEALPIFLDRLLNPLSAILISVTAILLFGEIIPQAVCNQYGLEIGSYMAWLVTLMMYATAPVSWPIAKLLDFLLGHKNTLFRKNDIYALVTAHEEAEDLEEGARISKQEGRIVHGTFELRQKPISDCMTRMEHVFEISADQVYNEELELAIIHSGHSRIPVKFPENGSYRFILVKELLLLPKDIFNREDQKIKDIKEIRELMRGMLFFSPDDSKFHVLKELARHRKHLAMVADIPVSEAQVDSDIEPTSPEAILKSVDSLEEPLMGTQKPVRFGQVLGLVTMEDIFEDIFKEEFLDETDTFEDNRRLKSIRDKYSSFKGRVIASRRQKIQSKHS